ncbi:MAG TPA: hemin uptake protein HemP [Paucimonas sp.]|nr:hemin uptake protein HemP [Paucimonas sp.]HJW54852.1 hemin uptake protein HemP [Burkholderiaceae bacterium]
MKSVASPDFVPHNSGTPAVDGVGNRIMRINSRELLQHGREIEIDHEGRIYRLRLTQLNKLILNA